MASKVGPIGAGHLPPQVRRARSPSGASFEQALAGATARQGEHKVASAGAEPRTAVTVSAHAGRRLRSRGLELTRTDLARIGQAAQDAEAKGIRDSLMLLGQIGLIVNVPNRTVVTALDTESLDRGIVTGIDGTVFLPRERG